MDLFAYTAAGALLGAAAVTAGNLYLTTTRVLSKCIWEDTATPVDRARATAKLVNYHTSWDNLPIIAGRGAAIGGILVFVLTLLAVGASEVFVSG